MRIPLSKKHDVCPNYENCDDVRCQRMGFCLELKIMIGRNKIEELIRGGLTKKEIRKQRKAEKKELGQRKYRLKLALEFRREKYAHVPPCVKSGTTCDKHQACSVINECLVGIDRIKANEDLINALRGPLPLKQIIQILAKFDPEPMKSYYFRSNGRKRKGIPSSTD